MSTINALRESVPPDADLSYVVADLRPLVVPIDSIRVDPDNARLHPEQNRQVIGASLERFQQRKPLVVNCRDGQFTVEAGNGTLEQARAAGWRYIAVVGVDDPPADARDFALVDNRSSDLSEFEPSRLAALLMEAEADDEDLESLGWTAEQVKALLGTEKESPDEFPAFDETIETHHRCPKCNYEWSGKAS